VLDNAKGEGRLKSGNTKIKTQVKSFTVQSVLCSSIPVQACREAQDEAGSSGCACLSVASSRPAGSFEHRREPTMVLCGQECRVSFLLVPFLWTSKEKILVLEGRNTQLTISKRSNKNQFERGMQPPGRAPAQNSK
jgi:hypothetical protein